MAAAANKDDAISGRCVVRHKYDICHKSSDERFFTKNYKNYQINRQIDNTTEETFIVIVTVTITVIRKIIAKKLIAPTPRVVTTMYDHPQHPRTEASIMHDYQQRQDGSSRQQQERIKDKKQMTILIALNYNNSSSNSSICSKQFGIQYYTLYTIYYHSSIVIVIVNSIYLRLNRDNYKKLIPIYK